MNSLKDNEIGEVAGGYVKESVRVTPMGNYSVYNVLDDETDRVLRSGYTTREEALSCERQIKLTKS